MNDRATDVIFPRVGGRPRHIPEDVAERVRFLRRQRGLGYRAIATTLRGEGTPGSLGVGTRDTVRWLLARRPEA